MIRRGRSAIGLGLVPIFVAVFGGAFSCDGEPPPRLLYSAEDCSAELSDSLFERRVLPLLNEERPTSCNECHLSGIDLGLFVRGSACHSIACLAEDELIDLQRPDDSLLLSWIDRASPSSPLITEEVLAEERDAVTQWIHFHATCGADICGDVTCERPDSGLPVREREYEPLLQDLDLDARPDGCSDLEVETFFRETVYASRGRCFPCHFDGQTRGPEEAPRWVKTAGNCDAAALSTLREIEQAGYINTEDARESLLLLKPLGPFGGGVEHGGADKFHGGDKDAGYVNFLRFLEYYSECRGGSEDSAQYQ